MKLICSWRQRSLGLVTFVLFEVRSLQTHGSKGRMWWWTGHDPKDPKIRNLSTWPTFEYREMESETKMSCFIQFWCHQVTHWDALKVKELSETFEGKASFLKARLWCCVSVLFSNVEQPLQPVEVIMFFSTTWITCTLLVMDCALFPGDGRQGDTWWVTWVTCQENLRLTLR